MSIKDILSPFTAWKNILKEPITVHKPLTERPGAPRYRGFHKNDMNVCIGCGTCEEICQNAAIDMVPVEGQETVDGDSGLRPQIDYGRCCWCALCVDICPTNSLNMSNEYIWIENDPEKFRFVPGADKKPWDDSIDGYHKPERYELYPRDKVHMDEVEAEDRSQNFLEYMMGYSKDQALHEADRCIQCGLCTATCPAHMDIPLYIKAIRDNDMELGLNLLYHTNPVPETCGRICPETCATIACALRHNGDAIAISWLKRYIADQIPFDKYKMILESDGLTELNKKVAIIGAGPAGLSIAYYLRLKGIASDIYEMMPKGGGMMRYGIPEYRMPKTLLDDEVGYIEKMDGINIFYNKKVGKDIQMAQLKSKYDAVAVTVGSWKPSGLRTKGEELAEGGIHFLEKIAKNDWSGENPGETIVIGGGNTAMDCVRTSIRLGSPKVICMYRRTQNEMPAEDIEIKEAMEEGVIFEFLRAPVSLREEDGKKILTYIDMKLGEPDDTGRRRPQPIEGTESEVTADLVIAAIGQKTVAPEGVKTNKWGDLDCDKETGFVEDNVFTAGDCATGPSTVIEAVGFAKRTALAITTHLNIK
jgi:glutamate synthase (NADPH) small chain